MKFTGITFLICVTLMVFGGCNSPTAEMDREVEIQAIARSIDSCIGWFKTKDFERLFSVVAHDPAYLSVHPTDRVIRGFDQFEQNAEGFKNPDFKYVRHELRDLTIRISQSGDVAWWYCRLDDMNEYQGRPANWENSRWTGVLEKRDGNWVIMQQHFSFAQE